MKKKYELPEDELLSVGETTVSYQRAWGVADAFWTLLSGQPAEVQDIIAERLQNRRGNNYGEVYTVEELNNRIDEAESQVEAGDVVAGECVHAQMREFVKSISV